jgi:hypothetical protein
VANAATDGPATVSVHFVTVDGQSIPSDPAHTAVIPAGGAINWYLPQVPGIAAQRDLYGSALIDSDRPVLAVVSEASLNGKSDTAAYNAISLPNPTDGLAAGPFQLRGGAPQWLARPQVVQP